MPFPFILHPSCTRNDAQEASQEAAQEVTQEESQEEAQEVLWTMLLGVAS